MFKEKIYIEKFVSFEIFDRQSVLIIENDVSLNKILLKFDKARQTNQLFWKGTLAALKQERPYKFTNNLPWQRNRNL